MTFALTPTAPFVAGTGTIGAGTLNTWRGFFAQSLDTGGGGDYSNGTLIKWGVGSAGWQFDAGLAIGPTGVQTIQSGGQFVGAPGSDVKFFESVRIAGFGNAGAAVVVSDDLDASGHDIVARKITAATMLVIASLSRIRAPFRPGNTSQTVDTSQGNHVLLAFNGGTIKTITLRETTAPVPQEGEWMLLVSDNANMPGANYHVVRENTTNVIDLGDPGSWAMLSVQAGAWRGLMYNGEGCTVGPGW